MSLLAQSPALDDAALDLLFRDARSVNRFSPAPVDPAEIEAAYDLLKWGPTAMNISPLRLAVVSGGAARERLVTHVAEHNQEKTLAAPLTVVAAADPAFHNRLETLAPHRLGMVEGLEANLEQRKNMARNSGLIQVGYLILALRTRGLQVGPLGGFDAAGVDADLFAESGWNSLLVLNVGWDVAEGGTHPRADRLDASDAVVTF